MTKDKKNLLVFGYGLPLILTVIGLLKVRKHGFTPFNETMLVLAVIVLLITIFNERWLKILYTNWMKVAHLIGGVVTTIIMLAVFYVIFTPVGIVLRILRKDLLSQRLEPKAESYWIPREKQLFDKERYTKQF